MTRFSYNQSGPNSCGAAVTMVALHELSVPIPNCTSAQLSKGCENFLWDQMKDLDVGNGVKEQCTPLSLVNFLHSLHSLSVTIVHDSIRVKQVLEQWSNTYKALPGFYTGYFTTPLEKLSSTIATVQSEINLPDDFKNDARVILLCLIEGGAPPSPLHYLLARKDGSSYYIMNPDGDSDVPAGNESFSDFLTEPPARGVSISGPNDYIYTGIALVVKKK